ncbi:MAG: arginine--tRNA ligase, partial [Dehalococcoidia bacterium]|nr:arginine--tRNA ligase [Dehalococcoidia bacterium]
MSVRRIIASLVAEALAAAQREDNLPPGGSEVPVVVERPLQIEHGDWATSLPLKLARSLRTSPLAIAQAIADHLPPDEAIALVWTAPPGFVNFRLSDSWLARQVDAILVVGEKYGSADVGKGQSVQVEFVSGNPTGPLHVGHARGAVIGSTLANVLEAAGYQVTREYYVNDAGSQMEAFHRSLYARYLQALGREALLPPNGYQGVYLIDLAREVVQEEGDRFLNMPSDEAVREMGKLGIAKMLAAIREDLQRTRVEFDAWFHEQSLYDGGQYARVMEMLGQRDYLATREGAVWFTSTALGEDKDNVLVRGTGAPTYFASDVAYHYNKFAERGFQRVVNIWGADHQGHVARVKAAVGALGIDPARLTILIAQMVALKRGDEAFKMSKRTGELITLRELVEEVGADACRYFFLARTAESQMEFDLELAKKESADNPVYYVQYAHARIAGILRNAQEQGIAFDDGDVSLLKDPAELALLRQMVQLPELIETMSETLEPHHLPHYALELATAFHWFYQQCRVISPDVPLTKARL